MSLIGYVSADLRFRILTPIWTAGSNTQQMHRIEETGLLGSMRWWHYILLHGDWNCDCEVKQEGDENRICPTCRLFVTTGWKRRFNLRMEEDEGDWPQLERVSGVNKSCYIPLKKRSGGTVFLLRIVNNGSREYANAAGEVVFS